MVDGRLWVIEERNLEDAVLRSWRPTRKLPVSLTPEGASTLLKVCCANYGSPFEYRVVVYRLERIVDSPVYTSRVLGGGD